MEAHEYERERRRFPIWLVLTIGVLVVVVVVAIALLMSRGGEDPSEVSAQTVRFEEPTDAGENPFTDPADVRGEEEIPLPADGRRGGGAAPGGGAADGEAPSGDSAVGAGPFGGTGSDLVCDRELLIRSLTAQPDRLRAFAGVLGLDPTPAAVARYIRSLTPVTLTQDTRVTNHTFVDGRAVPLQSVLAAGTAVLVDKYGRPVVRCRCGNPLLEPIFYPEATCYNCPPRYQPPPPCKYVPYRPKYPPDDRYEDPYPPRYPKPRYGQDGKPCYVLYPKPPPVKLPNGKPPPEETDTTYTGPTPPTDTGPTYEPDYSPRQERDHTQPEPDYPPAEQESPRDDERPVHEPAPSPEPDPIDCPYGAGPDGFCLPGPEE